jgi:diacylglycerol O-acyltransferase
VAQPHDERLSAMDLSFLAMEDGRAHMHTGSVSLYDAAPLRGAQGGIDIERVLAFAEAQLHKFPRLRQRLAWVPGFGQPVWVDDEHFNLRFHLRHTALPPPGDLRALKRLAGRVFSQEFDRAKPLWGYWFVDGVADDRIAVISKLHHCMADGLAGVALGNLLVGPDPDYRPEPAGEWDPRPAPSSGRLVLDELGHRVTAPWRLLHRGAVATGERTPARAPSIGGVRALLGNAVRHVSPTPLNVDIGPHRRFDWTRLPFDEVRRIGRHGGGTVNDAVLAIATSALRAFLRRRGEATEDLEFRVVVPVSVRTEAERARPGNRVSEMIVRLPLGEPDPRERLRIVTETTRGLKASGQAGAGDLLSQAVELLPAPLVGPIFRRAARSSAANLILTNVPGPRVPVFLLGARQLETYPMVPLLANQALGIALMSYDGGLFWGFNADWDAVDDLHDLVEDVEAAFAELCSAVDPPDPGE